MLGLKQLVYNAPWLDLNSYGLSVLLEDNSLCLANLSL